MVKTFIELLLSASFQPATVYGFGEKNCGDIGKPRACSYGAITASGEIFDPNTPSAAIPAPSDLKMLAFDIGLRMRGSNKKCVKIRLNDKSNPRWIGVRGFDLSPGAVRALGGNPHERWGGQVELCILK